MANLFEFIDLYQRGLSPALSKSTADKNQRCIHCLRQMIGADAPDPDLRIVQTSAFQARFADFLVGEMGYAPATVDETLGDLRKFLRRAVAMRLIPDVDGEKGAPDYRAPFDTLLGIIAKWVGDRPFAVPAADPTEYRRQREYDLNLRCAILYAFSMCCYGIPLRDIASLRVADLADGQIRIPSLGIRLPMPPEAQRLRYAFNSGYDPAEPEAPAFNILPAGATDQDIDKKVATLRRRIARFLKSKSLPLLQATDLSDDWLSLAVQSGLSSASALRLLAASRRAKLSISSAEQSCLRQQCKAVPAVQSPSGRAKLSISSAEQSCLRQQCKAVPAVQSPSGRAEQSASKAKNAGEAAPSALYSIPSTLEDLSPEGATYFSPGCQPWGQGQSQSQSQSQAEQDFCEANAKILSARNHFSEDWHMLRIFASRLNSSKLKKHLLASGIFGSDRDAKAKIYDPVDVLADRGEPSPLGRFLFFKSTPYTCSLVNGLSRDAAVLRSTTDRRFAVIPAAELKVMQETLRDFRDDVQLIDRAEWLRQNAATLSVGGTVRILEGPLRGREATIVDIRGAGPESRSYLLEFAQGNVTIRTQLAGIALQAIPPTACAES